MTLLSPWTALLAAAIATPILLALYMLKLRRQRVEIPSTLLWRQAFADLEANVPFQRLRASLMLFLQLLLIVLIALALGRPALLEGPAPAGRVILLLDQSASMSAVETVETTRLDQAKRTASDLLDRLAGGDSSISVMLIVFGSSARVVQPFTTDLSRVGDAIAEIQPTDEEADLSAALRLADAFALRGESDDDEPPDVMILSDGSAKGAAGSPETVRAGEITFLQAGTDDDERIDNVGIVSLAADRDYQDPAVVSIFARLANAGPAAVEAAVTLRRGEQVLTTEQLTIPPADDAGPGQATLTQTIETTGEAVLLLGHNHDDQLQSDNLAGLVLEPPRQLQIAVVSERGRADPFLTDLLELTEMGELQQFTLSQFENRGQSLQQPLDLVIYDRVQPTQLPETPSLSIGAGLPDIALQPVEQPGGRRFVSWDRHHPLLRHVNLDAVIFSGTAGYNLPPDAQALATTADGPAIALLTVDDVRHLMVAFALRQSNWPVDPSFPVFMQNALSYLSGAGSADAAAIHRPGEVIAVQPLPEREQLIIEGPIDARVSVDQRRRVALPPLPLAGLYTVEGARPPDDHLALSVLSDIESDIRPRNELTINARRIAGGPAERAAPLNLWPWVVAACLLLATIEWLVYLRQVGR